LVADNVIDTDIVIGKLDAPVLFQGIGQDIEEDSPLLFAVLSAASTAYSHVPSEPIKDLHVAGKKTVLVSALQARNNARVAISGSLELFSDKYENLLLVSDCFGSLLSQKCTIMY
jgi:oligosaccharyltransferase complex subunit beta